MVVLPSITQPASRRRAAGGASASSGARSSFARVPIGDGSPRVPMFSLMVSGTPSSADKAPPVCQRASAARACSSARSALTRYIALMRGSQLWMRARAARVASTGESSRAAYAAASWRALSSWMPAIAPRLYTPRGDEKQPVNRHRADRVRSHRASGARRACVARARRRHGGAARAPRRRLQRRAERISCRAGALASRRREGPAAPWPAAEYRAPRALLQPRRFQKGESQSAGGAEDLLRDGRPARHARRCRTAVRLYDRLAGVGDAREFRRRVQPPADGALDLDARHLGEVGLLQLFRARQRGRGALRRRRIRCAHLLVRQPRRARQAGALRSRRRAPSLLR